MGKLVAEILQNFENQIENLKQKDEDERCEKYLKEGLISGQPVWWIRDNGTKTRANARSMGKKGVIIDICYEKEVQTKNRRTGRAETSKTETTFVPWEKLEPRGLDEYISRVEKKQQMTETWGTWKDVFDETINVKIAPGSLEGTS